MCEHCKYYGKIGDPYERFHLLASDHVIPVAATTPKDFESISTFWSNR